MSIDSSEISVVVQGPIDWSIDERMGEGRTRAATRMIRHLLPDAEIILSSWENAHVDGMSYDKLVQSPDPGAQGKLPGYTPNNVNRQIASTLAGLGQATRPLCMKIRTDMILTGLVFLDRWLQAEPLDPATSFFSQPILSNNLSSRNSKGVLERHPDHPLLFHPSDHFHFGSRTDLLKLWDVPLQSEADAHFFVDMTQPNRWRYHELSQLTPEQYVLVNALRKVMQIDMRHYADSNPMLVELSERIMLTHFMFVPDLQIPLHFEKYHTTHHFSFEWMRHSPMMFPDVDHQASLREVAAKPLRNPQRLWSRLISGYRKLLAFPIRHGLNFLGR